MLKFFVLALLLCKTSSYVLLGSDYDTEIFKATDDPPTTENYLCEFSEEPTPLISKKIMENDGYEEIIGLGAYKVHDDKLSWNEANEICKAEGGNLIVIRTIFEAIKVTEFLEKTRQPMFWIGIHEIQSDQAPLYKWKTSLDENLTYDFVPPKPNRSGLFSRLVFGPHKDDNNQCGLLFSKLYAEISAPCMYPAPFICKREPL